MKVDTATLEVISPKVQINENYIETDYEYQTSHVKRSANGKIQVSELPDEKVGLFAKNHGIGGNCMKCIHKYIHVCMNVYENTKNITIIS